MYNSFNLKEPRLRGKSFFSSNAPGLREKGGGAPSEGCEGIIQLEVRGWKGSFEAVLVGRLKSSPRDMSLWVTTSSVPPPPPSLGGVVGVEVMAGIASGGSSASGSGDFDTEGARLLSEVGVVCGGGEVVLVVGVGVVWGLAEARDCWRDCIWES